MRGSRRASALAICALLAVVHTWPLAVHPGRYSLNDNADAQLNEWILAWIAHQLPRHPSELFQANIFYPAHDTLAFSEPLIAPALMGAPVAWAGASPVLVFNLLLLAGFALTAFAGCVLVEAWTGDLVAGLLTGSMLAFNTHTLTRLAHVQAVHLYGLPLALLAVDRLILAASSRTALSLALWMSVLAYTSGYLAVFGVLVVGLTLATRAAEWGPRARTVLPRLALAGVVAAVAVLPIALPYRRVAIEQHMVRALDTVRDFSATPAGYLATAGRVHFSTWSGHFFKDPVDSFFPGVVILACAVLAIVSAFRPHPPHGDPTRARITMLGVTAVAGFVLSLGTATPVYGWLYHVFPPMRGLRAAARFGNLFLLSVAVLGGLGLARWRAAGVAPDRIRPGRDSRLWIAVALVAAANVESLRAPFAFHPFSGIPGIYRLLAQEPGRVVVAEQPFYPRQAVFENGEYVLASTAHWRPLMNGYSGYTPDSYGRFADAFWYFPQERAIQAMKEAGVTHVVVHPARFANDRAAVIEALEKRRDFELIAIGRDDIRLYRLTR